MPRVGHPHRVAAQLPRQPEQQWGDGVGRDDVIDGNVPERHRWHARRQRVLGVLHDGDAARLLYRTKAGGAIVERAGEHHADHATAASSCGAAEQRVGGRAATVLAGASVEDEAAVDDEHVVVGWGHRDAVRHECLLVPGRHHGQPTGPSQVSGSTLLPVAGR